MEGDEIIRWVDAGMCSKCRHQLARLDLGNGIDAVFQCWKTNTPGEPTLTARMEPNAQFWRTYSTRARQSGWAVCEPWNVAFTRLQVATVDRFLEAIEKRLSRDISTEHRKLMEATNGNGILQFT